MVNLGLPFNRPATVVTELLEPLNSAAVSPLPASAPGAPSVTLL